MKCEGVLVLFKNFVVQQVMMARMLVSQTEIAFISFYLGYVTHQSINTFSIGPVVASEYVKRSKATNERQDDGAGILHQVAQFPTDQVYFIYTRRPCPSPPTQDPERQGTGC